MSHRLDDHLVTTTEVDASGSSYLICSLKISEPMHVLINLPVGMEIYMTLIYTQITQPYEKERYNIILTTFMVHTQDHHRKKAFLEDIHTLVSGDVLPQNKLYS